MKGYKIGFIGYGNMAKAIAASFASDKNITGVYAYDVNPSAADGKTEMKSSAQEVINASDYVFLSVKPQSAAAALSGLDFGGKIVISIMAGTDANAVHALCHGSEKIVRVMPNLCARVGRSVNAYCTYNLNGEEKDAVKEFLSCFGLPSEIDDSFFDVITGLTGSSPAYSFRYAKALTECGMQNGMSFEQSKDLVLFCVAGCMEVLKSCGSLEEMQTTIDNVCSKGGTTIEGIHVLDSGNFDEVVISAVNAAIARSRELGKK